MDAASVFLAEVIKVTCLDLHKLAEFGLNFKMQLLHKLYSFSKIPVLSLLNDKEAPKPVNKCRRTGLIYTDGQINLLQPAGAYMSTKTTRYHTDASPNVSL